METNLKWKLLQLRKGLANEGGIVAASAVDEADGDESKHLQDRFSVPDKQLGVSV